MSSQRGRQFASPKENSGILKHEAKLYNCCSTYIDRIEVFNEIMYWLICGCGVGYSLHKEYISKLPIVKKLKDFGTVEDSETQTPFEMQILTADQIYKWKQRFENLCF